MADKEEQSASDAEAADPKTSIFDLFEPPPERDTTSFGKIPVIKDDEIDLTDGGSAAEVKAAADAEAAGLQHWTAPPTGQVPAVLSSDKDEKGLWADVKGPSWHGDDPSWAGPDLADVFADTESVKLGSSLDEFADDEEEDEEEDELYEEVAVQRPVRAVGGAAAAAADDTQIGPPPERPARTTLGAVPEPAADVARAEPPARKASPPRSVPAQPAAVAEQTPVLKPAPEAGRPAAANLRPAPESQRSALGPSRSVPELRPDAASDSGTNTGASADRARPVEQTRPGFSRPAPETVHDMSDLANPTRPLENGVRSQVVPPERSLRGRVDAAPETVLERPVPIERRPNSSPDGRRIAEPNIDDIEFAGDEEFYEEEMEPEHEDGLDYGPIGGRNLPQAIGVGLALAGIVLAAMWFGAETTLALIVVLALLAVLELYNAMRMAGLRPATLLGIVGTVAAPAAAFYRGDAAFPLIVGLTVVFGTLWYLVGADTERPVLNLSLTMMGIFWVGGLAAFGALMIRQDAGIELLLATIIITVASDTMAYIGGRAYGSRPFHHASPNKTWEGTVTGLAGALFAGFAIGVTEMGSLWDTKLVPAIVLGAVVGCLAPMGDLAESVVKRDLGVKDMGTLLPGHGGVLDRLDGLLFALPGAYYLALVYGLI